MWVPRGLLLVRVVSKVEMGESRRERERERATKGGGGREASRAAGQRAVGRMRENTPPIKNASCIDLSRNRWVAGNR